MILVSLLLDKISAFNKTNYYFMYNSLLLEQKIREIKSQSDFNTTAIEVFYFQYENNLIYHQWIDNIGVNPKDVTLIEQIPFVPISLFKSKDVKSFKEKEEIIFTSSGTTGNLTSRHFVRNISMYKEAYNRAFKYFYGDIKEFTVLALLPSYIERKGSSLIFMAEDLIRQSNDSRSGFYLYNYEDLYKLLKKLQTEKSRVLLLGVSFALLEFAEKFKLDFPELIVMETGGMKGKKKELLRQELHQKLKSSFGVEQIHSEYGMTELMSQAYSKGNGIFQCPPWMNILIRETNDPFKIITNGKAGGINIIDLYNLYSCSFISSQDLGLLKSQNQFEIIGRFDNSDIRGCNLLVQ